MSRWDGEPSPWVGGMTARAALGKDNSSRAHRTEKGTQLDFKSRGEKGGVNTSLQKSLCKLRHSGSVST